jgi:hypothetical protein
VYPKVGWRFLGIVVVSRGVVSVVFLVSFCEFDVISVCCRVFWGYFGVHFSRVRALLSLRFGVSYIGFPSGFALRLAAKPPEDFFIFFYKWAILGRFQADLVVIV